MEVIFIGSGTGVPSNKRSSPGIIIKIADEVLLFDTGPGSLRKMAEAGFTYNDVDWIFYTHFHVDHIADFAPFLFATKSPLLLREKDLTVTGPKGMKKFYEDLVHLYGNQIVSNRYKIFFKEVEKDEILKNNWKVKTKPLPHTENSIGYRIESENKIVVYSGDTDYCEALVEFGKDADLLILECSFPEKVDGHLSPEFAGRTAKEAKAKRLILTHLYPVCDSYDIKKQCVKGFSGDITVAYDLMHITV